MASDTNSTGLLAASRAVTKLPAQDLDRARGFYRDKLGLEPIEKREGGLRYCCAAGEFHLFLSSGAASGTSTQMGFEVDDVDATIAELRHAALSSRSMVSSRLPTTTPAKAPESAATGFATAKATSLASANRRTNAPQRVGHTH